jgi:hypothetical protein
MSAVRFLAAGASEILDGAQTDKLSRTLASAFASCQPANEMKS